MSLQYEKKLEERIHQELRKLPERPAPENLAANVMAALKTRAARPWWRQPIPQWPRRCQSVFVCVMVAFIASAVYSLTKVWPHEALLELPTQVAAAIEPVKPALSVLETLTRAVALLAKSLTQPWLIGLAVGFMFVYLSCIGMGMAWYRVTFQKPASKMARA